MNNNNNVIYVHYGSRHVKARVDPEVPLDEIIRQLAASTQLQVSEPAALFALRVKHTGQLVTPSNLEQLLSSASSTNQSNVFELGSSPLIEAAEMIEKLESTSTSTNLSQLKLATFSLRTLIKEPEFLQEFVARGGWESLKRVVETTSGNTLAYGLKSLQTMLELDRDKGWERLEFEFVDRLVEIVATQPLINISRPATSILNLIAFSRRSLGRNRGRSTLTGFSLIYPCLPAHPTFLKQLIDHISSSSSSTTPQPSSTTTTTTSNGQGNPNLGMVDHELHSSSLSLVTELFKGAMSDELDEDERKVFVEELRKLGVFELIKNLISTLSSSSLPLTTSPSTTPSSPDPSSPSSSSSLPKSLQSFHTSYTYYLSHLLLTPLTPPDYTLFDRLWISSSLSDSDSHPSAGPSNRWRRMGWATESPHFEVGMGGEAMGIGIAGRGREALKVFVEWSEVGRHRFSNLVRENLSRPRSRHCPFPLLSLSTTHFLATYFNLIDNIEHAQSTSVSATNMTKALGNTTNLNSSSPKPIHQQQQQQQRQRQLSGERQPEQMEEEGGKRSLTMVDPLVYEFESLHSIVFKFWIRMWSESNAEWEPPVSSSSTNDGSRTVQEEEEEEEEEGKRRGKGKNGGNSTTTNGGVILPLGGDFDRIRKLVEMQVKEILDGDDREGVERGGGGGESEQQMVVVKKRKSLEAIKTELRGLNYRSVRERQIKKVELDEDLLAKPPVRTLRARLYLESYEFVKAQKLVPLVRGEWFWMTPPPLSSSSSSTTTTTNPLSSPTLSKTLSNGSSKTDRSASTTTTTTTTKAEPKRLTKRPSISVAGGKSSSTSSIGNGEESRGTWRYLRLSKDGKTLHYVDRKVKATVEAGFDQLPGKIESDSITDIISVSNPTTSTPQPNGTMRSTRSSTLSPTLSSHSRSASSRLSSVFSRPSISSSTKSSSHAQFHSNEGEDHIQEDEETESLEHVPINSSSSSTSSSLSFAFYGINSTSSSDPFPEQSLLFTLTASSSGVYTQWLDGLSFLLPSEDPEHDLDRNNRAQQGEGEGGDNEGILDITRQPSNSEIGFGGVVGGSKGNRLRSKSTNELIESLVEFGLKIRMLDFGSDEKEENGKEGVKGSNRGGGTISNGGLEVVEEERDESVEVNGRT